MLTSLDTGTGGCRRVATLGPGAAGAAEGGHIDFTPDFVQQPLLLVGPFAMVTVLHFRSSIPSWALISSTLQVWAGLGLIYSACSVNLTCTRVAVLVSSFIFGDPELYN